MSWGRFSHHLKRWYNPPTTNEMNKTAIILLFGLICAPVYATEEPKTKEHPPTHFLEITFGYAAWSDLGSLDPAPVDFVAEQSGRFEEEALGIEIAYHRHNGDHGKAAFLVGGELAGYGFKNGRSLIGYDAYTLEPATIRMEASWGHITGSVRWLWWKDRKVELLAGAGAGVYLVRFNDVFDDFGVADRGEGDGTFGAYIMVGLRFPMRSGKMGMRTELRVHGFSFSGLDGAFEGQDVGGPVTVFNFGMDF